MFRRKPLTKTGLPTNNALGRKGQGLPGWANSADFRDFEDGADGRLQAVQYGATAATDDPFASQIANGVYRQPIQAGEALAPRDDGAAARLQPVVVLRPFKGQIVREAEAAGFTGEESEYLFNQADKAADGYVFRPKARNAQVTPAEDREYRREIEKAVPDAKLRERVLKFYDDQFRNGRLRRVDKE
jgi:hypothetical protein